MNRVLVYLTFLMFLSACGGGVKEPLPALEKEALDLHLRGVRQQQQGEHHAARDNLLQAYRLFAAIEHRPGSSATLLNLAALDRLGQQFDSARLLLSQVEILSVDEHRGQLAYERSLLALANNNLDEAEGQALKAIKADKSLGGVSRNLLSRIHFLKRNYEQATEQLDKALSALSQNNLKERANAYRLRGKIELLGENLEKATIVLSEALRLDRKLNRPDKIALDLRLLASVHQASGDWQKELTYLRRLFAVEVNSGQQGKGQLTLEKIAIRLDEHGFSLLANQLRKDEETYVKMGAVPVQW